MEFPIPKMMVFILKWALIDMTSSVFVVKRPFQYKNVMLPLQNSQCGVEIIISSLQWDLLYEKKAASFWNKMSHLIFSQCDFSYWRAASSHWNWQGHIDGLMQERRNSIAKALELRLSCTNLSLWCAVAVPSDTIVYQCSKQYLLQVS